MRTDMPELPDRGQNLAQTNIGPASVKAYGAPSGTVYVLAVFLLLLSILGFIVWRIEAFDNWFWISLPAYFWWRTVLSTGCIAIPCITGCV